MPYFCFQKVRWGVMGWLSLTYTCVRTRACACGVTCVTRAGTDRITRRYVAKCYTYRQTAQDVSESTFVVGRLMYRIFCYRVVYVKWCDSVMGSVVCWRSDSEFCRFVGSIRQFCVRIGRLSGIPSVNVSVWRCETRFPFG